MIKGNQVVPIVEIKKPKGRKGGSVQTVYKILLTNLVRLTHIADQKAALMIKVNAITISLVLSFMFGQIQENHLILIPTIVLNLTCILAITYSNLATRPSTKMSKSDDANLLFFGHFANLNKADYTAKLQEVMSDEITLQEKIVSNIYDQYKVLNKKYKFLKMGYNVFMIGFPISILIYILLIAKLF
jgi:hypothetical protein